LSRITKDTLAASPYQGIEILHVIPQLHIVGGRVANSLFELHVVGFTSYEHYMSPQSRREIEEHYLLNLSDVRADKVTTKQKYATTRGR